MDLETLKPIVKEACDPLKVRAVYLYGSRARGSGSDSSDLDILLELRDIPPGEASRQYFRLLHRLEDELSMPVDVLTTGSLHRKALRSQIERERIPIYES